MNLKKSIKFLRSRMNFWVCKYDIAFLHQLRLFELNQIKQFLPKSGNLLEIGAGSGFQSKVLDSWNYNVKAIDLETSIYKNKKVFEITNYDGKKIPFKDATFSIVFSSNVFEHIYDIKNILSEISRVTKTNATIILVMPSSTWRIWTLLTDLIKNWHSRPHGVHATNVFEEIFVFSEKWWLKHLKNNNLKVDIIKPNNLFYTGNSILGKRFPIRYRNKLSLLIGGSCNFYILKKN